MGLIVRFRSAVSLLGRFPALAGVDLDVEAGEIVLLHGPNGAGKTTLLRACAGLVAIGSGEAMVLGHDLGPVIMIGGTVLTGMLATIIAIVVAYYVAVLSSRFGLDPDNQSVPIITSVMDLAGVVSFLVVLSLLGVVTHG